MSTTTFKDHFSRQAADYSRYRPGYPPELIAYVATLAPGHGLAVDCATGNGQAAVALAGHFDRVLAVDGSAAQLAQALPHPKVRYERAMAEALPVGDAAVDLVAVAQAVHWFDFDRFHAECRRVLVPGGVLAVWTYTVFRAGGAIDEVVDRFYHDTIGPCWPPERELVQQGYRTIPFPWDEITPPAFTLQTEWTLEQVVGYFASWSSVQQYRERHGGEDPLPVVQRELSAIWPAGGTVRLNWPLYLRVGRHRPHL
ncbi:MAG TPA: class I SAM-dependent methyltransferase [Steroidobacteraceae bacterium]|nr:class I SAM-dependent methyltransferase [Steroidobacteraceae bacterium]